MLATFVILVLIASDLAGHPMTEPTIGALRDLVIAYLAVQSIVDYRKFKSTDNIIKDMGQALLSEETTEKGEY